ncbi:Polyketide cyclase / dehydrase and lipid transport [Lentzea waywayandensis]|uniref:Polyketide cyclase / dehydrase and lipid transport n=1 Tax=Lentzea waywayandensis TaxID=84724 RepID=A0A1I6E4D8_9PSEU|nr:SRPBCC family protein [Lentzea waywayandensis]SFR12411.1 Polyketide cyclase / dehydrase and lipid transport [Lentzea waywayandensis]
MTRTRTALTALSLSAGLLAITACQSAPSSSPAPSSSAAAPTSVTCEGQGINPAAQLHHRTETRINAPLSTVWKVQTEVEGWPAWQKAVTSAKRLDQGELKAGSKFEWTTPAPATPTTPATTLNITSTVLGVKTGECVRWSGPAVGQGLGIDEGVHVWTFTEVDGGVLVRTEESWTGAQVEADPATAIKLLGGGLDFWLADLKAAAEARPAQN